MNIYHCIPYSTDKNLGKAYNDYVKLLLKNDDDWIFFRDGDTCFTTPFWGHVIHQCVKKYPKTGIFTCYTNRVGNTRQCYSGKISNEANILKHNKLEQYIIDKNKYSIKEHNRVISGYFFGFSKKIWKQVGGFPENGKILGVDTVFSRKVLAKNKKIQIIKGLYIFHFYRMQSAAPFHFRKHLK